jgi:hypothetical protein
MEKIVLNMPALDYLMAKWFRMYRIADTLTWLKFPPLTELRADLQDETLMVMNMEYIWDDPTCKWQIQEAIAEESTFHETMSRLMGNIGSKAYTKITTYGVYAAADISNSMFAQKRLGECREWQDLGLNMVKDDKKKDSVEENNIP